MLNKRDLSPALMVRTFPLFYENELVSDVAQTVRQALGERAITIVSPSGERQIKTAMTLQYEINRGMGENGQAKHDLSMNESLNSTQFRTSPEAVRLILTEAAIRGIWSPEADNGLVIVTSKYPVEGALQANREALGLRDYELSSEVDAGQVVEVDLDAIGYVNPEVALPQPTILEPLATQPLFPGKDNKWLDIFRRKRHN